MLGKISILYCSCCLRITLNDCFQQNNNQSIIMVEISKFASAASKPVVLNELGGESQDRVASGN